MSEYVTFGNTFEAIHSPIQEHHIDFILEEEFASNSSFLDFFIQLALVEYQKNPRCTIYIPSKLV